MRITLPPEERGRLELLARAVAAALLAELRGTPTVTTGGDAPSTDVRAPFVVALEVRRG